MPSSPDLNALRDRLIAWSNINSGSHHPAGLSRMANTLVDAVGELTPHIDRIPLAEGRTAIRAELRPNAAMKVLCSGHYDTVFEADHPFQAPRVLEDPPRLNGPGVADMKGGLVVMLATLAAFEKSPHAAEIGWTILLTPDEEIGSIYSAAVIAAEAPRHQLGLVFEPARESGAMVRSRAATSIFKIEVHGREAHAGRNPEDGRNAVTALARLCLEIDALPPIISNTLVNVGNFTGGGTVNIVPEFAQAEINARASTQEGVDALTHAITTAVAEIADRDGFSAQLSGGFTCAPLQLTPAREALFADLNQCAIDLGQSPLEWIDVSGGSDGNVLHAAGLPVLDGLGPIGGGLHSAREYIELTSLSAAVQRTTLFLERLAIKKIALP